MPRGNGMGPHGFGPMTGRGMGCCAGSTAQGYVGGGFGRGKRFFRPVFGRRLFGGGLQLHWRPRMRW